MQDTSNQKNHTQNEEIYSALGVYNNQKFQLDEDNYFRTSKISDFDFSKIEGMKDAQDLNQYHVAIS